MENEPIKTDIGAGWSITCLLDKTGPYYKVEGPGGKSTFAWDEYMARMYAKRLGWEG
jgi:hypothetical protein